MVMLPAPKYFINSEDGNHCGPAVWRMVLETFYPEQSWSYDLIDAIIRKEPGKYTWAQTFYPTMLENGVAIKTITTWDDRQFIERDWDYIRERSGEESARVQQEKAQELSFIKEAMRQYLANPKLHRELRPATFDDMQAALEGGAYVGCNINSRVLNDREGFAGHFVLIYGLDDENVYLMDPGPLHGGPRTVARELFSKAWSYTGAHTQGMGAFSRAA